MPKGGKRPGAGRPPAALTGSTRDDAIRETKRVNLTPIMVMADNMRFWYDAAMATTSRMTAILDAIENGEAVIDEESVKELNGVLKRMLFAREQAQSCASDMAPYRHPRLANIEVHAGFGDEPESDVPRITHKISPKDAAAIYEASLRS